MTLIGNVALRNRLGFRMRAASARLVGNRAEQNDEGFTIEEGVGEMTANIAKNNIGAGFVVDGSVWFDRMHDNVAQGNRGDGFDLRMSSGGGPARTLSGNYAINNLGHGLHVVGDQGQALEGPGATITGNTAVQNRAGDLADDSDCQFALWVANRFGTAAQPCIH